MRQQSFRLTLRANKEAFVLESLTPTDDVAPAGQPHTETVAASIIGCWVEIKDKRGDVLYRRFLHYLPLNLPATWHDWPMLKRKNARFYVDLPVLEAGYDIALYEQKYASPIATLPSRYCHFTCAINAIFFNLQAHTESA